MYPLLQGLRVVDVTSIILGPYATLILGDLGADVIKVEGLDGDLTRTIPPHGAPGIGSVFAANNRNKRSLAVDLKHPRGKEIMSRLLASADALVHNMRQEAMDRLGFGYEATAAINPRLVYCAAIGFGSDGPYRGRPAYDDIMQASTGLAGLTQMRDGEPAFAPGVIADKVAGLHVAYATLAALLYRQRHDGKGMLVEVPMFEAVTSFALNEHLMTATYEEAGSMGYHRTMTRNRRPHKTADGWIGVLPYTQAQWTRVLKEIGRPEIAKAAWFLDATERSRCINDLYVILADALEKRPTAEWLRIFERDDIPFGPVNRPEDLLKDPHLQAVGFFEPGYDEPTPMRRAIRQPAVYRGVTRHADQAPPALGEDSRAILVDLGYDRAEIESLQEERIVDLGAEPGSR